MSTNTNPDNNTTLREFASKLAAASDAELRDLISRFTGHTSDPSPATPPANVPQVVTTRTGHTMTRADFVQMVNNHHSVQTYSHGFDPAIIAYDKSRPLVSLRVGAAEEGLRAVLPEKHHDLIVEYERAITNQWAGYCDAFMVIGMLVASDPTIVFSELFG